VKKNWQEQNVYVNAPKRRTAYTLTVVRKLETQYSKINEE